MILTPAGFGGGVAGLGAMIGFVRGGFWPMTAAVIPINASTWTRQLILVRQEGDED